MPLVFRNRPGSVVALDDPALQCSTRLLGLDPSIKFASERAIVTRLVVSQKVNAQFLHTLGAQVYVYVFGDRMGEVTLSGLAFACECPGGADLGAEKMLLWYKRNRMSRRKVPARVMVGRVVIEGFITGMTEDVVDPSLDLVQWGVTLLALPDDEGDGPMLGEAGSNEQVGGFDESPLLGLPAGGLPPGDVLT